MKRLRRRSGARLTDWAFNRRALALARRREHVICLGDSHVKVMRHVRLPGAWLRPYGVGGATASGIMNPNSQTQSFVAFSDRLRRAKRWQSVLFLLGEVDCGFVIWHRAQRHGISVEEQLEQTLDAYQSFIGRTVGLGFRRVLVLSAPLPTIRDTPSEWGDVANLRKEVTASLEQRTELTLRFNEQLRRRCERVGATFVDVTSAQLDGATGLIAERFRREHSRNHHLADEPFSELIAGQLRSLAAGP